MERSNTMRNALENLLWRSFTYIVFILITVNFLFFLIRIYDYSFITLFSYFGIFFLAFGTLLQMIWSFVFTDDEDEDKEKESQPKEKEKEKDDDDYEIVSKETIQNLLYVSFRVTNFLYTSFCDIVMLKNSVTTLIVFSILIGVSWLGNHFTDLTLIWMVFNLMFFLPLFYRKQKNAIHSKTGLFVGKSKALFLLALNKIPKYKED